MSEEQITIAIAEACGWTDTDIVNCGGKLVYGQTTAPDYCGDLNAMHEAEEHLRGHQFQRYAEMLEDIIGSLGGIRATARQRAEAFLRTIGKWEEAAK